LFSKNISSFFNKFVNIGNGFNGNLSLQNSFAALPDYLPECFSLFAF